MPRSNWKQFACFLIFAVHQVQPQNNDTTTVSPTTEEPTTVPENTDLGICTCDLTGNGCDVNCCCDGDCTVSDRDAFSFSCDDQYTPSNDKACVRSSTMFRENTPYTVEETSDGLLCVQTDNYVERNYYEIPDQVKTSDEFKEYVDKYAGTSFQRESTSSSSELPTSFYKSGDAIVTVYNTSALGRLGLPRPSASQLCTDMNPAAFLYDQTFSCVRQISDWANDCEDNPMLDANTYFSHFKIVSTPEIFSREGTSTDSLTTEATTTSTNTVLSSLYDSADAIDILPLEVVCRNLDGFFSNCSSNITSPEFVGGICTNVVVRVEYVITHDATAGVVEAGVNLVLADFAESSSLALNQRFLSNFQKKGENETIAKSGNPGYVVGKPILAGKSTIVIDEKGTNRYVVEMDTNRNNMLTMLTSTAEGSCVNRSTERTPVTFGLNMRSGCRVNITFDSLENECDLINDVTKVALLGSDPPDLIAKFGNVTVEKPGDWVPILPGDIDDSEFTDTGFCTNIIMGMHLEILYANVGSLANPQAKIIGARRSYQQFDLSFQCIGPYCQPNTRANLMQMFEVTSSVGFVDVSSASVDVDAEYPQFTARLPEDFFYPFT